MDPAGECKQAYGAGRCDLVTCRTTPPALPPAPTRPLTAPVKRLDTNGTVLYTTPSDACAVNANSAMQATVDCRLALALASPIQKAPDEICVVHGEQEIHARHT